MRGTWNKAEPFRNRFSLPNEIFQMDLSANAKLIYAYLLYREDRNTFQCHPSYRTIGENVGMSKNTVRKYVAELVDKGLIRTEDTSIFTKDGRKNNGSLLYTILPVRDAIEAYHQRQLQKLAEDTARWEMEKSIAERKAGERECVASDPLPTTNARSAGVSGLCQRVLLNSSFQP